MLKCTSKFVYGFAASAAMIVSAGVYAQCDTSTAGNFTDTRFDSGASCSDTGGVDENGGWNESPNVFIEAGNRSIGDSFRVKGVVGTFDGNCTDTGDSSRDLDWVRFHVSQPCYITVSLSMRDNAGNPLDGTTKYDLLFIEQGSDSTTATDLYGAYGTAGCPHIATYTFANGVEQARFPVSAGDIVVVVTTPFPPASDNLAYHGPMPYGLDVSVTGYDNESCTTSSNDCTVASNTPGCSDGPCCDLVCGFSPNCCDSKWDASCVQDGVDQCGNFIYSCTDPWIGAPNDCVGASELVLALPAFISFDCTHANTDGPNDVARLCSSSTARDLWYTVGPMPYAGELLVTMCGQGNVGDSVISLYDLGTSADVGNPQDLPSKYAACRDDVCDDNGDGSIDTGGPAGINLIGIPAGEFLLVRVGRWLDTSDPEALGFPGTMQISFRAVFVDHGLQSVTNNAGTNTNLGLISGWSTAANPKRWSLIPFQMTVSGTVDGFDFAAFDNTGPDEVQYKVVTRSTGDASYGDTGRPFSASGDWDNGQVIASGSEPFDVTAYANVGDDYQQRFFVDISSPFALSPGDYYFTCYGAYQDGSTGASFAWLLYGRQSMLQKTTAAVNIDAANSATGTAGSYASGTPFGWRGIGAGPKMAFYNLGPAYTTQPSDDPALLYQCAFNLKGQLAASCLGDLDGSNEVDAGDLGLLLLYYGPCDSGCGGADLDGSGEVDSADLGLLLLSFGPCG
jgi:hypothetical protein